MEDPGGTTVRVFSPSGSLVCDEITVQLIERTITGHREANGFRRRGRGAHRPAEISLLGRNLLDEAYLVSPDSRAVLAPGLTGVVSLGIRF